MSKFHSFFIKLETILRTPLYFIDMYNNQRNNKIITRTMENYRSHLRKKYNIGGRENANWGRFCQDLKKDTNQSENVMTLASQFCRYYSQQDDNEFDARIKVLVTEKKVFNSPYPVPKYKKPTALNFDNDENKSEIKADVPPLPADFANSSKIDQYKFLVRRLLQIEFKIGYSTSGSALTSWAQDRTDNGFELDDDEIIETLSEEVGQPDASLETDFAEKLLKELKDDGNITGTLSHDDEEANVQIYRILHNAYKELVQNNDPQPIPQPASSSPKKDIPSLNETDRVREMPFTARIIHAAMLKAMMLAEEGQPHRVFDDEDDDKKDDAQEIDNNPCVLINRQDAAPGQLVMQSRIPGKVIDLVPTLRRFVLDVLTSGACLVQSNASRSSKKNSSIKYNAAELAAEVELQRLGTTISKTGWFAKDSPYKNLQINEMSNEEINKRNNRIKELKEFLSDNKNPININGAAQKINTDINKIAGAFDEFIKTQHTKLFEIFRILFEMRDSAIVDTERLVEKIIEFREEKKKEEKKMPAIFGQIKEKTTTKRKLSEILEIFKFSKKIYAPEAQRILDEIQLSAASVFLKVLGPVMAEAGVFNDRPKFSDSKNLYRSKRVPVNSIPDIYAYAETYRAHNNNQKTYAFGILEYGNDYSSGELEARILPDKEMMKTRENNIRFSIFCKLPTTYDAGPVRPGDMRENAFYLAAAGGFREYYGYISEMFDILITKSLRAKPCDWTSENLDLILNLPPCYFLFYTQMRRPYTAKYYTSYRISRFLFDCYFLETLSMANEFEYNKKYKKENKNDSYDDSDDDSDDDVAGDGPDNDDNG